MWHIVFNSGGIGSYITAKRVAARHGTARLIHLFTDTRSEDSDLLRFLYQSVAGVGGLLAHVADGRDIWQVFRDARMIGNSRVDPCSAVLKRDLARAWLERHFAPDNCVLYFGIDATEPARFHGDARKLGIGIRARWLPWRTEAPLLDPPHLTKCEMLKECERDGVDPPRLYDEGFPHNNCNGFCVKAGHAHFLHLLKTRTEVFNYHAAKEQEMRAYLGKDVAILRDRRGGKTTPLPMAEFRRQVEAGERVVDPRDWGKGCQCMLGEDETTAATVQHS